MTDDTDSETEHHLREALRHLRAAQEGDLRKTNAVAIEEVSNTVSTVLREHEEDE
ncbi:hypothetical protein RBH26_13185 [Natronolimnohabitans sp. A-GB9]|uniref:hypothetical protein n=1 Tax=Natronolimnohabitans sp. A-GB9 TaxID=3069757 RepID=UPI0027B1ED21|nr:hypothetical protein [Natronolimnohabitans sp. A-GB9]MDQ2051431.1 hypothetical protein [Natronolimnohabitans sp. A-GB9]